MTIQGDEELQGEVGYRLSGRQDIDPMQPSSRQAGHHGARGPNQGDGGGTQSQIVGMVPVDQDSWDNPA